MQQRHVLRSALILALVAVLAVLFVDRPLARALAPSVKTAEALTGPFIHVVEIVFGFPVSKFLTGAVLLVAAVVLAPFRRFRYGAWMLLLLGLSQLITRLTAGVLKNVFLRPRPYESLQSGAWEFFTDGSSFPSGHSAHFWPFFFVAVLAFPRWRIPLLVLATAVSVCRVVVNDHFLSDVVASAVIAALVCYALGRWILPRARRARLENAGAQRAT